MDESITLKKMSNLTGFSVSTVSKAWNDNGDVSQKTKMKILEIAKNYNYTPNHLTVSLRKQKSENIAVIVPDTSNFQYSCIVSEMQKLSFNKELKLFVFQHFEDKKMTKKCINALNKSIVDGVIIIATKLDKSVCYKSILKPNIVMELKKIDNPNLDNKKIIDDYFNRLMQKIE